MKETIGLKSRGIFIFRDEQGNEVGRQEVENIITNSGRGWVLGAMEGVDTRTIAYIDFGNGTGTPAVTDTTLFSYLATYGATTDVNETTRELTVNSQIPQGDLVGASITEIAIKLSDSTTLFNHAIFTAFNKAVTAVDVQWIISYP